MKGFIHLFIVGCFLFTFSVAVYGGGSGHCQCSSNNNRYDHHVVAVYIGPGYGIAWGLHIWTHNEATYAYALAEIPDFLGDPQPSYPKLEHNDTDYYDWPPYEAYKSGAAFSFNGETIHLTCTAANGGDGGAYSYVDVAW